MLVLLGLAIVAVAAAVSLYSPFAGLLFYWGWFLVRPQEFVIGLGGTYPLERFLVLALAGSFLLHYKLLGARRLVWGSIASTMLAFLFVNYLSLVTSIWMSGTLRAANEFAKVVLFFLLVVNLVDDPARLRKFLWVYALCLGWFAIATIRNLQTSTYFAQGVQRATSLTLTWGDPNTTASNLALGLPIIVALLKGDRGWWKRVALIGLVLLYLYCIILTDSRVGVILIVFVFSFATLQSSRRFVLIPLLGILLSVGWALLPSQYQQRYASILTFVETPDQADISAQGRIVGWAVAWQIFKDYPVLGVGTANFPAAFWGLNYSYHGHKGWFQPHNMPGQLMSELGVLGVLTFAAYIYTVLARNRSLLRSLRRSAQPSPLLVASSQAVLTIVLALFVAGFSSHNLYRYNWYMAGALVIILTRLASEPLQEIEAGTSRLASFAADGGRPGETPGWMTPQGNRANPRAQAWPGVPLPERRGRV